MAETQTAPLPLPQTDNPKRTARSAVKPDVTVEEAPGVPVSEQVTYVPGKDDPPTTHWGGFKFIGNVPITIKGHSGDPKKGECKPGERQNYELIEKARRNKFFRVGPFDPTKDAVPLREPGKLPETPEQYRAHAIAWAKTMTNIVDFDTQWQNEEALRMKCGVGSDDLDLIQSVIGPLRAELRKRAGFPN